MRGKIIFFFIAFIFFFLNARSVIACTPGVTGSCKSKECEGGTCPGVCFWQTIKWECDPQWCNQYSPTEPDCVCWPYYQNPYCYYDSNCLKNYCRGTECTHWSGWSPCNNCY